MIHNNKTNANFSIGKILGNESGMILLIASTFILIISIVVIGLINRNVSQALSAAEHYKQIQAEQLARGFWWQAYDAFSRGAAFPAGTYGPVTNNGITYTITLIDDGMVGGRHQYKVKVTY